MEENSIQKCWMYEKKRLSLYNKKRWVVLASEAIFIYKDPRNISHVRKIDLSEIKSIKKEKKIRKNKFFIELLQLHTSDIFYTFNENQRDLFCEKVEYHRQKLTEKTNELPSEVKEYEIISSQKTVQNFTNFKKALEARKDELEAQVEGLLTTSRSKINQTLYLMAKEEQSLQHNYNTYRESLQNGENPLEILRKHAIISAHDYSIDRTVPNTMIEPKRIDRLVKEFYEITARDSDEYISKRSSVTRALKWVYSGDRIDALTFAVSEDIYLTAVSFCRPYKPGSFSINELAIFKGRSTGTLPIYKHSDRPTVYSKEFKAMKKIKLSNRVHVKKNKLYTIFAIIEGDSSYKCVQCTSRYFVGKCQWEFMSASLASNQKTNRTDSLCGQFPEFHFIHLNSP